MKSLHTSYMYKTCTSMHPAIHMVTKIALLATSDTSRCTLFGIMNAFTAAVTSFKWGLGTRVQQQVVAEYLGTFDLCFPHECHVTHVLSKCTQARQLAG